MNKVAVINFSGNVGKSSIAHYLLAPRLSCPVLAIESINASDKSDITLTGSQGEQLQYELVVNESLVIDVGASNAEEFMGRISQFEGGIDEIDLFVVPTVPEKKQQTDTIATIDQLNDLGFSAKDILVVLNKYEQKSGPIQSQYSEIFSSHSKYENFSLDAAYCLPKHMFFEAFQQDFRTWSEVLEDDTDYRQLIADTDDKTKKMSYAKKIGLKKLALGINRDLDTLFALLFNDR